jgi:CHAD domain-containing protein
MVTRTRQQPVLHAVQDRILLWLRCRAQHALQALLTLTADRTLRVWLVELAPTRRSQPQRARHVLQAPPTQTIQHRLHVWLAAKEPTQHSRQQSAQPALKARLILTWSHQLSARAA